MENGDEDISEPANPNLHFSTGDFTLPNGDKYSGEYCAHIFGLIWREGHGIYTSKDEHTYEGDWKDDKLIDNEKVKITYPTGEQYHGVIVNDKYCGPGTYVLQDKMDISCEFLDNRPTGAVYLTDIHKRVWQGNAGENNVTLYPQNQFYYSLSETVGIAKLKNKYRLKAQQEAELLNAQQEQKPVVTDDEMRQRIFAKNAKMPDCLDFNESKWCQRYLRYTRMKSRLVDKVEIDPEAKLTEEDQKWLAKYEAYTKRSKAKAARRQSSLPELSLLQTYHSEEYKKKWPALRLFYPTSAKLTSNGSNDEEDENT